MENLHILIVNFRAILIKEDFSLSFMDIKTAPESD